MSELIEKQKPRKVLLIKTSSLGDVIHTLPALTDAQNAINDIQFDWVVEKSFSEIASWHPAVNKVIPVQIRKWRKNLFQTTGSQEWKNFKSEIKSESYDAIIDAQGLLKSALLSPLAKGPRYGLDKHSAREPLSSWFYQNKISVAKNQHAVERIRQLFSQAIGYELPTTSGDYGIKSRFEPNQDSPYVVFLHGTTWETKHYPEVYWAELIRIATNQGFKVKLLWGNMEEHERAARISEVSEQSELMPKMSLESIANLLCGAHGSIAVDTGLGHLSASVDCPTLSLFSSTNPGLSGAYGNGQKHLQSVYDCSPCMRRTCSIEPVRDLNIPEAHNIFPACFSSLKPEKVWKNFMDLQLML